ncbi:MAG: AAA family ATPase, partial [Bacteroidetes bacterium]|nr:AAA family ATPase [Bacteroidota bacterium]
MIQRSAEKKLLETLSFFPVVGIVGPRQVGKTTLAKKLQTIIDKESLYIDLENPRDLARLSDPVLFFETHADKCILIDEIQLMPELFSIIRPMVDMNRIPGRFIILGSASPILIRKSSESLAGRIAYFELSGLNFTEVRKINQNKLWMRGGFPDAFLAPNSDLWKQWQENFIKTYI